MNKSGRIIASLRNILARSPRAHVIIQSKRMSICPKMIFETRESRSHRLNDQGLGFTAIRAEYLYNLGECLLGDAYHRGTDDPFVKFVADLGNCYHSSRFFSFNGLSYIIQIFLYLNKIIDFLRNSTCSNKAS